MKSRNFRRNQKTQENTLSQGGRESSRVLCPATILVFIENTHIDSWAENPTTYPSRVECSKVLCPDREFYALDTQCCRGRVQCESNCDYQCTYHCSTPQTQIMIQAPYIPGTTDTSMNNAKTTSTSTHTCTSTSRIPCNPSSRDRARSAGLLRSHTYRCLLTHVTAKAVGSEGKGESSQLP